MIEGTPYIFDGNNSNWRGICQKNLNSQTLDKICQKMEKGETKSGKIEYAIPDSGNYYIGDCQDLSLFPNCEPVILFFVVCFNFLLVLNYDAIAVSYHRNIK